VKQFNRLKTYLILGVALVLAVGIPFVMDRTANEPQTRHIKLEAQQYGYNPSRITVNKGDTVIIKPTSLDVTHGFFLDGHPVEAILKQKGVTFQKVSWEDDDGKIQTDWDRVSDIEFTAEKAGKFVFRCTQTCGNLHPFMTGELVVTPNRPYHLFVGLSLWVVLAAFMTIGGNKPRPSISAKRIDLLARLPWLKWIVKRRSFHFLVLLPNLVVFYLFIISSLWGSPVGNRNIAIVFVWIFWWFLLKAIFVPLGGRLWCMVCPLPAPAEWLSRKSLTAVRYIAKPFKGLHHRFSGLELEWPKALRNIWLQNILFLCLISFGMILITRPFATAVMFLGILIVTLVLVIFFRRRVFCLYLCPVGGFLGTYSMASISEVRVVDPDICKSHKEKECLKGGPEGWACPWGQYPGNMARNNYCGMCTECIKSCPKDNVSIFARPFGSDRRLGGYDEMFNVLIMLTVAIAFSIVMLGPWGLIKNAANVTETRQLGPFLLYLAAVWSAALIVLPGLFALCVKGAKRLADFDGTFRDLALRLAYIFIPVGIFAWIAFSLPAVMVNYDYIVAILSDPLGLGWDLFNTAGFAPGPFMPEWIPIIQGWLLLAGLYLGLKKGALSLEGLLPNQPGRVKALVLPALLALLIVNFLMRLYLG
jgi:plastocyanin